MNWINGFYILIYIDMPSKHEESYELIYEWSDPVPFVGYDLLNGTRRGTWQYGYTFLLDEYDTKNGTHCVDLRVIQPKTWNDILIEVFDNYEELENALWIITQFLSITSKPLHIED